MISCIILGGQYDGSTVYADLIYVDCVYEGGLVMGVEMRVVWSCFVAIFVVFTFCPRCGVNVTTAGVIITYRGGGHVGWNIVVVTMRYFRLGEDVCAEKRGEFEKKK